MLMLINGKPCKAGSGEVIDVFDPARHCRIDDVPRARAAEIDAAVSAARQGLQINRRLPAHERRRYLLRTAELILRDFEPLRGHEVLHLRVAQIQLRLDMRLELRAGEAHPREVREVRR